MPIETVNTANTMVWPYHQPTIQPSNFTYTLGSNLQQTDLDKIRALIREEVHHALYPEETQPSITAEIETDGKRWKGTLYLVEDEAEEG